MKGRVKVLLAILGIDVHNRGLITVAMELRDEGMEVIYLGNSLPDEIIAAALQEQVDVIGVSSLGGAHLSLGSLLLRKAADADLKEEIVFLIGGVFSPQDAEKLETLGFDGVFPPGSTKEAILTGLRKAFTAKQSLKTRSRQH
jgi:methylmalonyl-CoA mutase C-terminal domain/subunit